MAETESRQLDALLQREKRLQHKLDNRISGFTAENRSQAKYRTERDLAEVKKQIAKARHKVKAK